MKGLRRSIKQFLVCLWLVTILSCQVSTGEKTWVYMELAIDNKEITDEFIYGRIDNDVLLKLQKDGSFNKLFTVSDIRYIGLNDSFEVEENNGYMGKSTYHLGDVRQIDELKKDPLFFDTGNPLSARSIRIRDGIK